MATNKNAILRYQTLDRCFRNPGKNYFIDDLIEECNKALYNFNGEQSGIKKRQLYEDVRFMESEDGYSIPLEKIKDGRKTYYRYSDLDFSINNQPLNETEINQLQSTLHVLSRFQGLPQFEWIQELLPRLQKGIDPDEIAPVLHFDENQFLRGKEQVGELFNHILYKKVLEISYKDFKSTEAYSVIMHPYILKEFNNRWFLFGYNPERNQYNWSLALDRIKSIKVLEKESYLESIIDWGEYFEDVIGVTKKEEEVLTKIQIWVSPFTAPYIETKPLHGSQKKIQKDEKGLVVEIEIIPNYEFYHLMLYYGDKIKILSPQYVVDEIKDELHRMMRNY